jgi:hypothetical protein
LLWCYGLGEGGRLKRGWEGIRVQDASGARQKAGPTRVRRGLASRGRAGGPAGGRGWPWPDGQGGPGQGGGMAWGGAGASRGSSPSPDLADVQHRTGAVGTEHRARRTGAGRGGTGVEGRGTYGARYFKAASPVPTGRMSTTQSWCQLCAGTWSNRPSFLSRARNLARKIWARGFSGMR